MLMMIVIFASVKMLIIYFTYFVPLYFITAIPLVSTPLLVTDHSTVASGFLTYTNNCSNITYFDK